MSSLKHEILEHIPRLKQFVLRLVKNEDDADDIVQDTVYQYLRNLGDSLGPINNISAWLCRVARNLTINKTKKRKEERLYFSPEDDNATLNILDIMADGGGTREDDYLRDLFWQTYKNAIFELPPEQRIAFELTEVDGLSTKEAAELAGVSTKTFLSRKHYAVKHLRRRLLTIYEEIMEKD